MHQKLFGLFLLVTLLSACVNTASEGLIIESFKLTDKIPSASGVEAVGEEIFMVGDDSPFLYQLDKELNIVKKYSVSNITKKEGNRVVKTDKADFESMAKFGDSLFVLGSGSKIVSRDTMVVFSVKDKKVLSKHNIRSLYQQFLMVGGFDSIHQINIEGLAASASHIYFLHRGNICGHNDIYRLSHKELDNYLISGNGIENIQLNRYALPKINGFLSGFSGACLSEDEQYLYFTSSVEATNDVYHDGEVLGSFIGRIQLKNNQLEYWPLKEKKQFVKTKLESVSIIEQNAGDIRFICTSDNDDGSSGIHHFRLTLKPESND
jgi:hypothetical protein